MNLGNFNDQKLLEETEHLAKAEREITLKILHHLAEISRRRLFSALGYSSLFAYCVEKLKYSESAAQRRIQAMRALSEIPELEAKVESGLLTLSNLASAQTKFYQCKKAGQPLAVADKKAILKSLEGKSTRAATRDLELTFPKRADSAQTSQNAELLSTTQDAAFHFKLLAAPEVASTRVVAVNEDLILKLKGLLAHKTPGITDEKLVELALTELAKKLDPAQHEVRKRKSSSSKGESATPTEESATANEKSIPEHGAQAQNQKQALQTRAATNASKTEMGPQKQSIAVTAEVRRAVWRNAKSRCEHCGSQNALQIEHAVPRALGGGNELNNLKLLCRFCNQRQAIEKMGIKKMELPKRQPHLNSNLDKFQIERPNRTKLRHYPPIYLLRVRRFSNSLYLLQNYDLDQGLALKFSSKKTKV